jgi:hypothetical protein
MTEAEIIKKLNFSIVSFDSEQVPEFLQKRNKKWVYYGKDNLYPDYLVKLFNRSAKHNAIVEGKQKYIAGKGWMIDKPGTDPAMEEKLQEFISKANACESLNDILHKVALDFIIFNGFAIEVIWNKVGTAISEIHHIPFQRIRTNEESSMYFYTRGWHKSRPEDEKDFKTWLPFDPLVPNGSQLYYFMHQRPKESGNDDVYTYPEYIGCIPYIEVDYQIANFHLNNIRNGFWGSFLINFNNGIPSREQQREIEDRIKHKFSGTDNAGKFLISYNDDPAKATTLSALTVADMDKMFVVLNQTVQQEIFTGHTITSPMLFGIKTEGQLGGRDEIVEAEELFQNTYVQHKQAAIERVFNTLAKINGLPEKLKIQIVQPIGNQFSEATLVANMSRNEIRAKAGLPTIENSTLDAHEQLLSTLKALPPNAVNLVLQAMTKDELRSLAGLPASSSADQEEPITTTTN